jgi:hypothetical protein
MSAIVVDFLPAGVQNWPSAAAVLRKGRRGSSGAPSLLAGCFAPPAAKDGACPLSGVPGLRVLGDVDTWAEHVVRGEAAARKILTRDDSAMQPLHIQGGIDKKGAVQEEQQQVPVSAVA